MNATLKITRIGNSAGIILPKEVLAHLDVDVGATLSVVTTPRGIELSAAEPDFEAQMAAGAWSEWMGLRGMADSPLNALIVGAHRRGAPRPTGPRDALRPSAGLRCAGPVIPHICAQDAQTPP